MFMRASRKEGLHNNIEIDKQRFKLNQLEVEQVFLNEIELKRLINLDLSAKPKLEIVRDVFLIGCYIGQRYCDYKSIKKAQILQLDAEKTAIEILQSKSGKRIILPLRAEAVHLLKKYDFTLPYTYEQQINSLIQEIARMAGLDELTETKSISGGRLVKSNIPRYKLIKTHTARRSGCTNMYLANIPINEIMTISGHQTVYDFMKYIRASDIQIARKLAVYPYFSGV
jgi:integrase